MYGFNIDAISEIISNDDRLNKLRENAFNFAKRYTSKEVFGSALKETFAELKITSN